jgi:hypothetical protein
MNSKNRIFYLFFIYFCYNNWLKKARSPSTGRPKVPKLKPTTTTQSTPINKKLELTRSTKIKIKKADQEEPVEFTILYDDLIHGDLLGRGQFGTVNKMYHKNSDMTFAVKVSENFSNIIMTLIIMLKLIEDKRIKHEWIKW